MKKFLCIIGMAVLLSCSDSKPPLDDNSIQTLFELVGAEVSGLDFQNQLDYDADFNIYTYRNFYNGGGVAIGDVNNDGLVDLYFTANMKPNKLYLNKGNLQFEDITAKAGVAGDKAWSTGVSMTDVNGDGLLDIYVCNSGDIKGDNKQNELFINNGDLTFHESAEAMGLADAGYSTHAAFFDYDGDGDLDMYLLNNSYQAIGSFNLRKNERPRRDPVGGDKLFRQDQVDGKPKFINVSEEAGIYGSIIGFGLGVTVGDINQDGWQDIFISNDFFERDYLYMNNGDGTFTENLTDQMRSISAASMGADMADINNDGHPDIFVTDMLPEPDSRIKTVTTFENWDRYQYNVQNDYHHQFIRNMLHLNNANNTFSEVGRLTGVHATDWSWGALMADFNNDGYKDIFVANGIYQDLTDQDYIQFISNEETVKSIVSGQGVDYKTLIDAIPSQKVPNYMFVNQATTGLSFKNHAIDWGLAQPSHSNGAAYGDLDNDGDLDLVVNNVNMPVFLYKNRAEQLLPLNHTISLDLKGLQPNTTALGAKVNIFLDDSTHIYQEQMPMRGFQSTVDHRLVIGLGEADKISRLQVVWPSGKHTDLYDVTPDTLLTLHERDAVERVLDKTTATTTIFQDITSNITSPYQHTENPYVDFDKDRLIFHMMSTEGPKIATGDLNGDGLSDLYVGGAKDSSGQLLLQTANGFSNVSPPVLLQSQSSEDTDAAFFDADGDGDLDLYITSGGNEFNASSSALKDRLLFNDGQGQWRLSTQLLPAGKFENSSCVRPADFDQDGDIDLFVGIRLKPFYYGLSVDSYLLQNDGRGNFTNVSTQVAPELQDVGMVTDGHWSDWDGDGDQDLIVIGDWMSIKLFENNNGHFKEVSASRGLEQTAGWWNSIKPIDFDLDGDLDYVLANHGLNSRFKASPDQPVTLTLNDFDGNGTPEQIISAFNGTKSYPLVLKHDLVAQMPELKKKYLKYANYKEQTIADIFNAEQLSGAVQQEVTELRSCILVNNGTDPWSLQALPLAAQLAPMYGIEVADFDKDGLPDILMAGNFYQSKPEVGRYDASYGIFLKGTGTTRFIAIPAQESGVNLQGAVRHLVQIQTTKGPVIGVARNNDRLVFLKY